MECKGVGLMSLVSCSCSVAVVLSFWVGFAVRLTCAVFFFSGCLFVLDDSFGGEEMAGDGMNYPAWLITLFPPVLDRSVFAHCFAYCWLCLTYADGLRDSGLSLSCKVPLSTPSKLDMLEACI